MSDFNIENYTFDAEMVLSLYNKLRASIFICNHNRIIITVNEACEKFLKLQKKALIGRSIDEFVIEADMAKLEYLNKSSDNEDYWELNFLTGDGDIVILNCYKIVHGQINAYVGRISDPVTLRFQEELMTINNQVTNLYRELERKNRQLELMNKILEQQRNEINEKNITISRQLELSRKIQQHFVKNGNLQLYDLLFKFNYVPAYDIGGDYFDVIDLKNGKVGLFISDVSGHGISAALIMAVVMMVFHKKSNSYENPSDLLTEMNNELYELFGEHFEDIYCTAFYCVIDTAAMVIEFCSAGHPAAWVCNSENKKGMEAKGFPLGMFKEVSYDSNEVTYDKDDSLAFFTDGFTDIVLKCSFESVNCKKLIDKLKAYDISKQINGVNEIKDDVSLILVEVNNKEWKEGDKNEDTKI